MAKNNQWGNQNPYIEEELSKQWPKETNGLNLNPYIEEELLWYLLAIVSSAFLWYTYSDYRFGIFWLLLRLLLFDIQILITALVSFGHCVVCFSSIYRFWLPLWLLVAIVSSILLRYTDSDYPLVSFGHCVVCSSSIYRFWLPIWYLVAIVSSSLIRYTDSDYPFGILTQWPQEAKGVIRICISKKSRRHNGQKIPMR
jgi:hypothetical protein